MKQWMIALALGVMFCVSPFASAADNPTSAHALRSPRPPRVRSAPTAQARLKAGLYPLRGRWNVVKSDHFVVAYDAGDAAQASRQASLLELTYARFYQTFRKAGFPLTPITSPLICVSFPDRSAYLGYARRVDRVDMAWTVAYYSARTNRIAFFRYGPAAAATTKQARIDDPQKATLYGNARTAHSGLARFDHRIQLASTTHEAAHQLAFNSGLQRRGVVYPLWVSEGLATNFELQPYTNELGPDVDNVLRRRSLERAAHLNLLLPLKEFITMTRPPTANTRATDVVYAQAWGLFHFLYHRSPHALMNYLAYLDGVPDGTRDAQTMQRAFAKAFGDIDQLSGQWRVWIKREDF